MKISQRAIIFLVRARVTALDVVLDVLMLIRMYQNVYRQHNHSGFFDGGECIFVIISLSFGLLQGLFYILNSHGGYFPMI